MKHVFSLVVLASLVVGCSDSKPTEKKAPVAKTSVPAPEQPVTIAPIKLPEEPAELVATIGRQVKVARSLHAQVVIAGGDSGKQEATADVRTDTPTPTGRITMTDPEGTTHAVLKDGFVYARDEGQEIEVGKPWMRISHQEIKNADLDEGGKFLSTILSSVERYMGEISTDTGLALVKAGKATAKPVKEQFSGVQVTRYDGSTETSAMREEEYQKMSSSGIKALAWQLWVDERGLPRRYSVTVGSTKASTTATYSNWGIPVTVQAPPASQVALLK
ncbi:hypothetical protein [Spirillospora sp. CA-294931]|uniref:hypothetical protein n=1 Tax=Spirillospora sp. CA-294931 TaxID=3240042 RepID=UPI003D92D54B